jgi:hypothetical protein
MEERGFKVRKAKEFAIKGLDDHYAKLRQSQINTEQPEDKEGINAEEESLSINKNISIGNRG